MKRKTKTKPTGSDEELNFLVEKLNAEIKILKEINQSIKNREDESSLSIPENNTSETTQKPRST